MYVILKSRLSRLIHSEMEALFLNPLSEFNPNFQCGCAELRELESILLRMKEAECERASVSLYVPPLYITYSSAIFVERGKGRSSRHPAKFAPYTCSALQHFSTHNQGLLRVK